MGPLSAYSTTCSQYACVYYPCDVNVCVFLYASDTTVAEGVDPCPYSQ